MKRSEVREAVFFLTFEMLFSKDSEGNILYTADEVIEAAVEADIFEMNKDVEKLFRAVNEKAEELDGIISGFSEKRQVNRIHKVPAAILRIAVYEMMFDDSVPDNVAISEAVILTKKFAYEADVQFVNGLLGALFRSKSENANKDSENENSGD